MLDVGAGVKPSKGDHVVLHWRPSNGLQSETPTYMWNGRKVNAGWVTTFNDHAIVSENRLTPIPADFDMNWRRFSAAVTTAMGVVNNDAHLKIGQSVVILVWEAWLKFSPGGQYGFGNPIIAIDLMI